MKLLHRRRRVKEPEPRFRMRLEMPPAPKPRGRRRKTPRDPGGHSGLWPDLWTEHRCGPHDHP